MVEKSKEHKSGHSAKHSGGHKKSHSETSHSHKVSEAKVEKSEVVKAQQSNAQSILTVLLIISLLANVYFIVQVNELTSKIEYLESGQSGPSIVGTSTTTPVVVGPSTTLPQQTTGTGTGDPVAEGDIVRVDYVGSFENGSLFDTSLQDEAEKGDIYNALREYEPLRFVVGAGQMIEGFENGVVGMRVGEEKTIIIPPEEGYPSGALAGETLIFKVYLREILAPEKIDVVVLSDKRCSDCDTMALYLMDQLEGVFPGLEYEMIDYGTSDGQKLYSESDLTALPAILFETGVEDVDGYDEISQYLVEAGDYLSLRIGATFDPAAEICDNGVDDNGDDKVDCDDPTCESEYVCMDKVETPVVEAFVMSHCPYGTQIEKGLLPVARLLGDKIDFNIKFCDYAMHGEKELQEQLLQYCMQEEMNDKYLDYLECFLAEGETDDCLDEVGIKKADLESCISETDEEFKVTEGFNDKSTWLSGNYPTFNVFADLTEKYSVRGSPTFVVNGVVVEGAGRDSQSLLDAVCVGFADKPEECDEELSSTTPSAGFGFSESSGTSTGGCGA